MTIKCTLPVAVMCNNACMYMVVFPQNTLFTIKCSFPLVAIHTVDSDGGEQHVKDIAMMGCDTCLT